MSDATIILRAAICSQHFDEGCLSCRSARECSDRELDRLRSCITVLEAEVVRLRSELKHYGRHTALCRSLPMHLRAGSNCECGWQHARVALEGSPPDGKG